MLWIIFLVGVVTCLSAGLSLAANEGQTFRSGCFWFAVGVLGAAIMFGAYALHAGRL